MGANSRILMALKWVCGTANLIGLAIVVLSIFANGYNKDFIITIIGCTILVSASSIFLIGLIFVATEEMVMNTQKGERVIPLSASAKVIHFNKAAYAKRKRRASN